MPRSSTQEETCRFSFFLSLFLFLSLPISRLRAFAFALFYGEISILHTHQSNGIPASNLWDLAR